jgi:hypothetical protein
MAQVGWNTEDTEVQTALVGITVTKYTGLFG